MEAAVILEDTLETVTSIQAGKELGMSALTVRRLMEQDRLPIGYFIRAKGKKRGYYKIYRSLLDAEIERIRNGKNKW